MQRKLRFEAVRCIAHSYKPTVPVGFIAQTLGHLSNRVIQNGGVLLRQFSGPTFWHMSHPEVMLLEKGKLGELILG